MKLRLLYLSIMIVSLSFSRPPETTSQEETSKDAAAQVTAEPSAPKIPAAESAPIVTMIFGNESNDFEIVFTLAQVGDYFGNKNAGTYYPHFLPNNGKITRETFTFDPGALEYGPNVYPFMFTYKDGIYYIVFVTSKILNEKTDYPFFATIVKITDVQEKSNSAEIETIANLYFKQNDTLALGLMADKLEFYNVTQKTKAGFITDIKEAQSPRVQLAPKTKPKALPSNKKKITLKGTRRPVAAQPIKRSPLKSPLVKPISTPRAVQSAKF